MSSSPLHHIVRVRSTDDLTFARPGLMDELMVNANQLENSVQSTAASLWTTTIPFCVDPVLWRFQVPQWWRNEDGETKKNYARLGAAYAKGTRIDIAAGPLLNVVPNDEDWRTLAANTVDYQQTRLDAIPSQLDLFDTTIPRDLHPSRILAPALVAYSAAEDRINGLLLEASATRAGGAVAAQVIVPLDRLLDRAELDRLVASIPTDGVESYFIWTPQVTEELLFSEHAVFAAILRLIHALAGSGILVGHQYGNYAIAALHDAGLFAVTHHLGWVDKGEPVEEQGFMIRSCRTYVPGVRHSLLFHQAEGMGRDLDADDYAARYCECSFCAGTFDAGQHPLDLLLEDHEITFKNGRTRLTPTARSVAANTWHYLLSRRLEIQAFSEMPAADVIRRDIDRAALLSGVGGSDRLRRLARELRTA